MAVTKSFMVTYEVVNVASVGQGLKYKYRKGPQQALVAAANVAAIPAILAGDVTVGSGETIEILDAHEAASQGGLLT